MKLFNIVDGKVVLNTEELSIPLFKQIYEKDKTKDKQDAFNKISYIVFMYKWDSPYASIIDEKDRDRILKKDIFKIEDYKLDDITLQAIERFKQFQYSFSLQFLERNMLGAKKLMEFYEMINWTEVDKTGKFKYSDRSLASNLKEAGNILQSLEKLKEQVRKEELESVKTRGSHEVFDYEDAYTLRGLQK